MDTYLIYRPMISSGLGDVIFGCISTFLMAKIHNKKYKITIDSLNLFDYFNIPEEYKINHKIDIDYIKVNLKFDDYILHENIIREKNIVISTYYNFSQLLYKLYPYDEFLSQYKEHELIPYFFNNIGIPKSNVLEKCKKYNYEDSVCVHIRCGDVWSDSNCNDEQFKVKETVYRFVDCIKNLHYTGNLYLLSDNMPYVTKIFDQENIKYQTIEGIVGHSGKSIQNPVPNDCEKTIVDLYIIGECTQSVISYWSNFSRIGVLRTGKDTNIVLPDLNQPFDVFGFNVQFKDHELSRIAKPWELLSKIPNII